MVLLTQEDPTMKTMMWSLIATVGGMLVGLGVMRLFNGRYPVPIAIGILVIGAIILYLVFHYRDKWKKNSESKEKST